MAYQLEYAFRELKKSKIKRQKRSNVIFASVLLAAAVISAHLGGSILELVLRGYHEDFYSAASEMVVHLQEGMGLNQAVYVFCDEVLSESTAH